MNNQDELKEINELILKEYDKYFNDLSSDKQKKIVQEVADETKLIEDFWNIEYPQKSFEEKVSYWLAAIHTGMRYQGETTGDDYLEFSKENYELWKKVEPKFDDIMKEVIHSIGDDFDIEEYYKRISGN